MRVLHIYIFRLLIKILRTINIIDCIIAYLYWPSNDISTINHITTYLQLIIIATLCLINFIIKSKLYYNTMKILYNPLHAVQGAYPNEVVTFFPQLSLLPTNLVN